MACFVLSLRFSVRCRGFPEYLKVNNNGTSKKENCLLHLTNVINE